MKEFLGLKKEASFNQKKSIAAFFYLLIFTKFFTKLKFRFYENEVNQF